MQSSSVDLSWLCLVIPLAVTAILAVLCTRSRLKYAKRIFEAQTRGAFKDLNKPEIKARIRILAALALASILGTLLSLMTFLILGARGFRLIAGIFLAAALIFGILGATAGHLMKREIDRRL